MQGDDANLPDTMRAAVLDRYGDASHFAVREIPRPVCGDKQVTIRVRAASINPIDWRIRSGSLRLLLPQKFPLVLGFDVAGEIVEVGASAGESGWKVGDEVFCFLDNWRAGGYAEFATASAHVVARKPTTLTVEEAAAVPLAALTSFQSLRHPGKIAAGDQVLINGASGGVGIFAVQIAKALGAHVTGTCSEHNREFVRELGAEHVIDYTREDFLSQQRKYDIVYDAVAKSTFGKCRRVLKPGGRYITTVPTASSLFFQAATLFGGRRCLNILARPNGEDLQSLAKMIDDGLVRPFVEKTFPLEEVATAHRVSEAGHVRGKLVLRIANA